MKNKQRGEEKDLAIQSLPNMPILITENASLQISQISGDTSVSPEIPLGISGDTLVLQKGFFVLSY